MNLLLLTQTKEPDYLINNFTGFMFTAAAGLGIFVLIRGIYKGETIKAIITQILTISLVAGIAIKPIFFANIGTAIINLFISFTKSFTF